MSMIEYNSNHMIKGTHAIKIEFLKTPVWIKVIFSLTFLSKGCTVRMVGETSVFKPRLRWIWITAACFWPFSPDILGQLSVKLSSSPVLRRVIVLSKVMWSLKPDHFNYESKPMSFIDYTKLHAFIIMGCLAGSSLLKNWPKTDQGLRLANDFEKSA